MKYIILFESFDSPILNRYNSISNGMDFKRQLIKDSRNNNIDASKIKDDDILYLSYMEYDENRNSYSDNNRYLKYFFYKNKWISYSIKYDFVLILDKYDLLLKYPLKQKVKAPIYFPIKKRLDLLKMNRLIKIANDVSVKEMYNQFFKSLGSNLFKFLYTAHYYLLRQMIHSYNELNDKQVFSERVEVLLKNTYLLVNIDYDVKQLCIAEDIDYNLYLSKKSDLSKMSDLILDIFNQTDNMYLFADFIEKLQYKFDINSLGIPNKNNIPYHIRNMIIEDYSKVIKYLESVKL